MKEGKHLTHIFEKTYTDEDITYKNKKKCFEKYIYKNLIYTFLMPANKFITHYIHEHNILKKINFLERDQKS